MSDSFAQTGKHIRTHFVSDTKSDLDGDLARGEEAGGITEDSWGVSLYP